jgi:hypothetical protein
MWATLTRDGRIAGSKGNEKGRPSPDRDEGLRLLTNVRYFAQQMPPPQHAPPPQQSAELEVACAVPSSAAMALMIRRYFIIP